VVMGAQTETQSLLGKDGLKTILQAQQTLPHSARVVAASQMLIAKLEVSSSTCNRVSW
jgi:hypothetical protein